MYYIEKVKRFISENKLFFVAIVATVLFITSPLWLQISFLSKMVSCFLKSLNEQGFKSSYIETCGAILGTFLAVTGALWTQRKIDEKHEKSLVQESATVVYYDFKFAINALMEFEQAYACIGPGIDNGYDDVECFNKYRRGIDILIDGEWIHNVSKLRRVMSDEEIKQIYELYGVLENIKKIFRKEDSEITIHMARQVYNNIMTYLCSVTLSPEIEVKYSDKNKELLEKLERIIK